jgi:hypothetical protein
VASCDNQFKRFKIKKDQLKQLESLWEGQEAVSEASPSGEMIRRFAGKRDDDGKKREVKASVKGTKK